MLIHLDDIYFNKIKNGEKTIELRLYDDKRKNINIDDVIKFEDRKNGEIIKCKVIKLHLFKNFKELFRNKDINKIGFDKPTINDYKKMEKFYSIEEQEKYGVVGIEIELLK